MKPANFIQTMQRRTGVAAVGPSTLRGQGRGVLRATQTFLGKIDLSRISSYTQDEYAAWLNRQTLALLDKLPIKTKKVRPWGTARKAINLFMRDALYNQYLNDYFRLVKLESYLEIPLDSAVAKGLKKLDKEGCLPKWPRLKYLKVEESSKFQDLAERYAVKKVIARVHLDAFLWLENR